jgi:hypothetical protein
MTDDQQSTRARVAPAFNTGGGGFEFEDLVGAWCAAALAAGAAPLGVEIGIPGEIRFQGSASGWALDDLVITGEGDGQPRWSASVKSFDMLSGSKLPAEFVATAWSEILASGFRAGRDRVGFVCGRAAEGNWDALLGLIGGAIADVDGLAGRIKTPGAFNETQRALWRSCECPAALAEEYGVAVESSPARLLAALLPRRLDLLQPGSTALAQARQWCLDALAPEHSAQQDGLWEALGALVSELRPQGGALGWTLLGSRLGSRFVFRLRPDVAPDWELLTEHTVQALNGVRDQLGDGLALPRASAWAALELDSAAAPVALLFGASGCGKTALAKRWVTDGDGSCLWLSSSDLDDGLSGLRARLGLRLGVSKVLGLAPRPVRVVIDGLDRSYRPEHFAAAAAIARDAGQSDGHLQVLITAQQMELARVSRRLAEANAPAAKTVSMGDLDDADVAAVLLEQPQLARVALGGQLQTVLRRPKLLDLVLRAGVGSAESLEQITDEAAVAALWWQHFVLGSAGASARQELVLKLAERQADRLLPWTPAGELSPADVDSADSLRQDGVLDEDRARYAFAHDLFADWTLLQRLSSLGPGALAQLGPKAELPSWHRAIRLLALSTLRDQGIQAWSTQRAALDAEGHRLIADLFLDAALFADDAEEILRALWPQLIADEGDLLRRLLRRFLYVATVPDPRGAAIFSDSPELAAHWAAQARLPLWPLWLPVLGVLHEHRDAALEGALAQVASAADLWLRHSGPDWPLRAQAADLALAVGRLLIDKSTSGWVFDDELEARLWRSALAAGSVDPAALLSLVAPPLGSSGITGADPTQRTLVEGRRLRAAILDADALLPVIAADPATAGGLSLLAAIEPAARQHFSSDDGALEITDAPHWAAPLPERGPFLALLLNSESLGIECVLGLVEHATRCWVDERASPNPSPLSFRRDAPEDKFEVVLDGDPVELIGDAEVMHWYRGAARVPAVLASAMMALESYVYRRLDAGHDVTAILDRLKQSRSVAVWGLLVEFARFRPALLRGALSPIASSAALLVADKLYTHQDHSYLLMATLADRAAAERIRSWNTMPHRQIPVTMLVMRDVVTGQALVEEVANARRRWEEADRERWKHLLAQTDAANYQLGEGDDGEPEFTYIPPAAVEPEVAESRRELADSVFWLTAPSRLRQLIDAGDRPADDELEQFWTDLQGAPPGARRSVLLRGRCPLARRPGVCDRRAVRHLCERLAARIPRPRTMVPPGASGRV